MCEFCTKHGEGKKWYLQMLNYSQALLEEELNADIQKIVRANTRLEWNQRFWKNFVMPAITGIPKVKDEHAIYDQTLEGSKQEHFGQVIPIEDVEQVIDRVDSITRMPCGCRYLLTGKTDQRYCFGIGIDRLGVLGKFPDSASSLEVLSREEAKRIIRSFDDGGQIHTIWTGVTPLVLGICNCDHDCGAYWGYSNYNEVNFFRAEYIASVDNDACTGCRECMGRCAFGAMSYSNSQDKVFISSTRCFGCGVCRAACPAEAIELQPRSSSRVAADLWV